MSGGPTWPLVGRDEELNLLAATVADGAASLVVAGPAGVGKSRLASELLARTEADGFATRTVRATRSTATIPFGAFAPWIPAGPLERATDRLQVLRSVTDALVADRDRVVVAVDDAHLLDDGSAALVLHLVAGGAVSLIATVRSGEPCPDAVTALWKDGLAERVDLQPLAQVETVDLLATVLGGPVDAGAQQRVWALTQGLPLYVREVVRAARDQRVLVEEDGRWIWHGALAGSDRLLGLIDERLAQADDDERRLVELVAFGEPLPLAFVDELGLRPSLTTAEHRGSLAVSTHTDDGGDGDGDAGSSTAGPERADPRVRLAHPLYGEVVRSEVPNARARDLRSALVTAAVSLGWQRREPLRVAAWALDSDVTLDPSDAVAAARRALELSEWSLAERLSAGATSAGVEAVLTRAISLAPQVRWDEDMARLAQRALDSLDEHVGPQVAGEAARIHAWLLFFTPGPPITIVDVIAATDRLPAPIRPAALVHSALQAALTTRTDDAVRLALAAAPRLAAPGEGGAGTVGRLDQLGDLHDVEVQALAVVAFARAMQGRADQALAAAEVGLPHVAAILAADPVPGNPAGAMPVAFCLALVLRGRIAEAAAIADLLLDGIDEGARALRSLAGSLAARMALFAGALDRSRLLAAEAFATCQETGQLPASHWPASVLAGATAQTGDGAAGRAALDWAADACPVPAVYGFETRLAHGWLHAAAGRTTDAQTEAVRTADAARSAGMDVFALLALLDLARFGAADEAVTRLAGLSDLVAGPFADAVVAHASALAGRDAEGLAESSRRFEAMGAVLLAAEAAAVAATVHGEAGRTGSEATERGRARVLAARCGRPVTPALRHVDGDRALGSLTAREREVVEQAARGLTNREIADLLFVSVRTVNTHLYRSYAKLGVNDREQLAPLVLGDPPTP